MARSRTRNLPNVDPLDDVAHMLVERLSARVVSLKTSNRSRQDSEIHAESKAGNGARGRGSERENPRRE